MFDDYVRGKIEYYCAVWSPIRGDENKNLERILKHLINKSEGI